MSELVYVVLRSKTCPISLCGSKVYVTCPNSFMWYSYWRDMSELLYVVFLSTRYVMFGCCAVLYR